jgi:hypothetical protein
MQNYIEVSTTDLYFTKDLSSNKYKTQIEIKNLLPDKTVLTKLYIKSYMNYSANPSLLITKPNEKGIIKITYKKTGVFPDDRQEKMKTISIPIENRAVEQEEAKALFKESEYKTIGQKINYNIKCDNELLIELNKSTKEFNTTRDESRCSVKGKIEEKQKMIQELNKKIQETKIAIHKTKEKIENEYTNQVGGRNGGERMDMQGHSERNLFFSIKGSLVVLFFAFLLGGFVSKFMKQQE